MAQAVVAYLNGGNWRNIAEFTEIESCRVSALRCDFVLQPVLLARREPIGPEITPYLVTNHFLSTFRGQASILVTVHSVLRESLRFGNISVSGSDRMDNLPKVHS
jgi:hypothetical protein